jgi:hypothetical protein
MGKSLLTEDKQKNPGEFTWGLPVLKILLVRGGDALIPNCFQDARREREQGLVRLQSTLKQSVFKFFISSSRTAKHPLVYRVDKYSYQVSLCTYSGVITYLPRH